MPVVTAPKQSERRLQPLENGEHLDAEEFLRRYEAMPEVKKAELIQGIVYMGSPVRALYHGRPDNIMQAWVGFYCSATPGIESSSNSTVCLDAKNVPQPDALLQVLPEYGGQSRIDEEGYIVGAPELVIEIAASSSSIDAHEKRESYARAKAREYLLWRTLDAQVDWWSLEGGEYRPLPVGADGITRSKGFPGLWLDRRALIEGDRAKVMACLQRGIESGEHKGFVSELAGRKATNDKARMTKEKGD